MRHPWQYLITNRMLYIVLKMNGIYSTSYYSDIKSFFDICMSSVYIAITIHTSEIVALKTLENLCSFSFLRINTCFFIIIALCESAVEVQHWYRSII